MPPYRRILTKRKIICALIVTLALAALLIQGFQIYAYPGGYTSTQIATYNNAGPVIPGCSIEIFLNGTYTAMKDCGNGAILFYSTNSAAVINDAIGNLTKGGLVFIKAGFYAISAQITLATNITLAGEGMNATVLQQTSSTHIWMIYGTGLKDVTVRDLTLDGNNSTQSGNDQTGLVYIVSSYRPQVLHNLVRNGFAMGIYFSSSTDGIVQGNILVNVREYPILFLSEKGGRITTNTVIGAYAGGIRVDSSSEVVVSGNDLHWLAGYTNTGYATLSCIDVETTAGNSTAITITENMIYSSNGANDGVFLNPSSNWYVDTQIVGNNIWHVPGQGIYLYSGSKAENTLISSNVIDSPGLSGININSATAYRTSIVSNVIRNIGTGQWGINVVGTSVSIVGNQIYSIVYRAIEVDNSYNGLIADNVAWAIAGRGFFFSGIKDYNILNNYLNGTTASSWGMRFDGTNTRVTISGGEIAGFPTYDIYLSASTSTLFTISGVRLADTNKINDVGLTNSFLNNPGYNPRGSLAAAFVAAGNYILDSGGVATPVNATTMTVYESPKAFWINVTVAYTGTNKLIVKIDGTEIMSTTAAIGTYTIGVLYPGETLQITYRANTNFIVSGE